MTPNEVVVAMKKLDKYRTDTGQMSAGDKQSYLSVTLDGLYADVFVYVLPFVIPVYH